MKISWPPSRRPRREVKLRGEESLFKLPQVETLLSRSLLLDRGLLPPRSPPSLILKSILPFAEISERARATRENHPLSLESLPRSSDWSTDRRATDHLSQIPPLHSMSHRPVVHNPIQYSIIRATDASSPHYDLEMEGRLIEAAPSNRGRGYCNPSARFLDESLRE